MSQSSTESSTKLLILSIFDRGYLSKEKNEHGEVVERVKREVVHCRLLFFSYEELYEFLRQHRPIMPPSTPTGEKPKETKWMDYMTATKKEMGL